MRARGCPAIAVAVVVLVMLPVLACAPPGQVPGDTVASLADATTPTGNPSAAVDAPGTGVDSRATLEPLTIDDGTPPSGYRRELFPTWRDVDQDGCDARRQALVAASTSPAQTGERCEVIAGSWTSAYDGATTTDPTGVQIDHVVPLANAWRSGADRWTAEQRTRFANDQFSLWAVSAASNQSKGDRGPDEWRPPQTEAWCAYALRWTEIKVRWNLTATTAERDALGQLLDTC